MLISAKGDNKQTCAPAIFLRNLYGLQGQLRNSP